MKTRPFPRQRLVPGIVSVWLLLILCPTAGADGDAGALAPGGPSAWHKITGGAYNPERNKYFFGDVSGDGRPDAIWVQQGKWTVALNNSTASGFGVPTQWATGLGSTSITEPSNYAVGDVNGDGRLDAAAITNGNWSIWYSTGSKFTASAGAGGGGGNMISGFGTPASQYIVADVNRDGFAEAITYLNGVWRFRTNQLSPPQLRRFSAAETVHTVNPLPPGASVTRAIVADVNGDGFGDAATVVNGTWYIATMSWPSGFGSDQVWASGIGEQGFSGTPSGLLADINNDARMDAIGLSGGTWKVALANATGDGFGTPSAWNRGFDIASTDNTTTYFAANVEGPLDTSNSKDLVTFQNATWYVSRSPSIPDQIKASGSGWTALLNDEFNGTGLDSSKWGEYRYDYWLTSGPWNAGNPMLKAYNNYEDAPNNATSGNSEYNPSQNSVSGGMLTQKLTPPGVNGNATANYQVGSVNTLGRIQPDGGYLPDTGVRFKWGYVEARVKIPNCTGCWPAFWMLPAAPEPPVTVPATPPTKVPLCWGFPEELDIFEFDAAATSNHFQNFNSHWNLTPPTTCPPPSGYPVSDFDNQGIRKRVLDLDLSGSFHTYGFLWTSTYMQFFLDGVAGAKITVGIPQNKMYLISTLQHWGSIPTTGEAQMDTDYVKVYQ